MRKYIDDDAFTDDILIEVLKRLPLDKLFDLKCVCKRWDKIISSNYFCTIYKSEIGAHENHPSTPLGFYRSDAEHACLPTCLQKPTNIADQFYFKTDGFRFVDSCNGLLLFHNINQKVYRVCNPVTKQFHEIDQPYSNLVDVAVAFDVPIQEDDVEVLNNYVLTFLVPSRISGLWHVYTKSAGATVWTEFGFESTAYISFRSLVCAVVINKVYYWLSFFNVLAGNLPSNSQDTNDFFVDVITLPVSNNTSINVSFALGESRDGLLQYARSDPLMIVVWVKKNDMDDYEKCQWRVRYKVSYDHIGYQFKNRKDAAHLAYAKLAAFHPSDPGIIFILVNEIIISYCFHNGRIELVRRIQDTDKKSGNGERYDPPWEWSRRIVPYVSPTWAASFLVNPK